MATRTLRLPSSEMRADLGVAALVLGALLLAGLMGAAMAFQVPAGLAVLIATLYAPLVIYRLRLAVALWVPLAYLEGMPALNLAGKAAGLILLLAWIGGLAGGIVDVNALRRHRRLFEIVAVFVVWVTISALWAPEPGQAIAVAWRWWTLALIAMMIVSTASDALDARRIIVAMVVGGTLSVLTGIASGDLTSANASAGVQAGDQARLGSAVGDPNFLAAALVPAIVLAAGLIAVWRRAGRRMALIVAMGLMALGVVASESRGGAVAAAGMTLAALVFFKRRRVYVVAGILLVVGAAAAFFATTPSAWERITKFDNGGSGRSDLWSVAVKVIGDHPILGVGLENYSVVSKDYVRRPGSLEQVHLIAEVPHVVHNTYLQFAAEVGLVGLGLFLWIALTCLRCAWRAARNFDQAGDRAMEALARAVLVGSIGLLANEFFISGGDDRRMWVLLMLGPALLSASERRALPVPLGPGGSTARF